MAVFFCGVSWHTNFIVVQFFIEIYKCVTIYDIYLTCKRDSIICRHYCLQLCFFFRSFNRCFLAITNHSNNRQCLSPKYYTDFIRFLTWKSWQGIKLLMSNRLSSCINNCILYIYTNVESFMSDAHLIVLQLFIRKTFQSTALVSIYNFIYFQDIFSLHL